MRLGWDWETRVSGVCECNVDLSDPLCPWPGPRPRETGPLTAGEESSESDIFEAFCREREAGNLSKSAEFATRSLSCSPTMDLECELENRCFIYTASLNDTESSSCGAGLLEADRVRTSSRAVTRRSSREGCSSCSSVLESRRREALRDLDELERVSTWPCE